MMKLAVKKSVCVGCMLCESACSIFHDGAVHLDSARVQISRGQALDHTYGINICRQCKICPPIDACPEQAICRDDVGAIIIDYATCVDGCSICVDTCHLDAVFQTPGAKPAVCDLCGGEPQCVKMCEPLALATTEVKMVGATN